MMKVKNTGSGGKNSKRGNHNLSSKIYYQTEGHPQYKNLPKGHPDPEDEEAVAAYRARKERDKHTRRGTSQQNNRPTRNRRNKPYSNRSRHAEDRSRQNPNRDRRVNKGSGEIAVQQNENQEKASDIPVAPRPAEQVSDNVNRPEGTNTATRPKPSRRKRVVKDIKRSKDDTDTPSDASKETSKLEKPKKTRVKDRVGEKATTNAEKATPVEHIREEDYAGTALTSDRSAATIISDTMRDATESSGGNMHADYQAGNPVSNTDTKE